MLPEPQYRITRVKGSMDRYNLDDEYSQILGNTRLNAIFEFIRTREADEGMDVPDVQELEF